MPAALLTSILNFLVGTAPWISPSQVGGQLEEPVRRMREQLAELKAWYKDNKESTAHIRVHTGTFVGAAATDA